VKKKLIALAAAVCLLFVAAAGVHGQLAKGTLAVSIDSASSESTMTAETTEESTPAETSETTTEETTTEESTPAPASEETTTEESTPAPASEETTTEENTPAAASVEPAAEETTPSNEETTTPEVTETTEEQPTTPEVTEPTEEPTTPEVTEPTEEQPTTPEVTETTEEPTTPEVTESTEEPTTPEVTEPTEEPTTPEVTEPTEEPTTPEVTEPTEEPTTPEVTEPTEEPTTPEVTEPTEGEETEEPEIEIINPLAAGMSASSSATAGEAISGTVSVSGGVAPYQVTMSVVLDGVTMDIASYELAEAGSCTISYQTVQAGMYTISASVADAAANAASADVQVAVEEAYIDYKNNGKWQALADEVALTGDWRTDVLLIAQSQLGYTENTTDVEVSGDEVNGYTLYGEWAGNAYTDWCAAFLGWCFEQAETGMDLRLAAVSSWVEKAHAYGAYKDTDYAPEAGDIIFIIPNDQETIGHIGIVEYVNGDTLGTIEANVGNMVDRRTYQFGEAAIGGYMSMTALMDAMNIEYAGAAAAYEVQDVEDFTAYLNTDETVNVRFGPSTDTMRAAQLSGVGTPVTVTAQVEVEGTLWYLITCEDAYGTQTGYMMAKFLDGKAPAAEEDAEQMELTVEEDEQEPVVEEEPAEEPVAEEETTEPTEEPVVEEEPTEPAVCACYDEAGVLLCTEGCECLCHVPATLEEVVEEEPVELPEEIAVWAEETDATPEMIERAMNAESLESVVIEESELIYVRTGEPISNYIFNAETGEIIDTTYNLTVAIVDMETNMVYPVATGAEN